MEGRPLFTTEAVRGGQRNNNLLYIFIDVLMNGFISHETAMECRSMQITQALITAHAFPEPSICVCVCVFISPLAGRSLITQLWSVEVPRSHILAHSAHAPNVLKWLFRFTCVMLIATGK